MVARYGLVVLFLTATALNAHGATLAGVRPSRERPDVVEVGDPVLVGRSVLEREMQVNTSLREYIELYGWPDYAEIQEITVLDPWAAYEVRVYYLRRNQYLIFGRVHVAPHIADYGVRKYDGVIDSETLDRLLTAPVSLEETAVRPHAGEPLEVAPVEPVEVMAAAEAPMEAPDAEAIIAASEEAQRAMEEDADTGVIAAADAPIAAEEEAAPQRVPGSPDLSSIVARLEAAADRASVAAAEAERASLAAMASADRATTALERVMAEYEE